MICLGLIALIALLDLMLKSGIEALPEDTFPRTLPGFGGRVELRRVHNEGFPMGVLRQSPRLVQGFSLFVICTVLLRFSLLLPQKRRRLEKLGLAMVLGGALSNLTDRFFRHYLVDYLYIKRKPLNRIVWNLGDGFIALGMLITLSSGLLPKQCGSAKKE